MSDYETYDREHLYREQYRRFMELEVPPCTGCGSRRTASVQVGVIAVTIRLVATCSKFKLIPNGPKPSNWFCNSCGRFFDVPTELPEGVSQ